jgi:hypothetical protein
MNEHEPICVVDDIITRRDIGMFALKVLIICIVGTLVFLIVGAFAPNPITASNMIAGAISTNIGGLLLVLLYTWLYYHPAYQDIDIEALASAEPDAPARTNTIENICTSVDDQDIDAWLARQDEEGRGAPDHGGIPVSNPYSDEQQRIAGAGVCIECERNCTELSPAGLCEGCTLQAQIEQEEQA